MKNVVVTGSGGFIGKNLLERLRRRQDVQIATFERQDSLTNLRRYLDDADIVFHFAGVNRPKKDEEFEIGNAGLTRKIVDILEKLKRTPTIVFPSSIQASLDNLYGRSKKRAEDILLDYGRQNRADVYLYRLPNVFGKWCRPNYNSVVATYCHNIARDMPISISDAKRELELIYIDDRVENFGRVIEGKVPVVVDGFCCAGPTYRTTLGQLAEMIRSFRGSRQHLLVPDFSDAFVRCLYATYISYLPENGFAYALRQYKDDRGELAEILKSPTFGQIFVSRSRPGIVRGNHSHDTKVEKFVVLDGEAIIRFRNVLEDDIIEYQVSARDFKVVDIPPGYLHSIENTGANDLIVLFWANQIFDVDRPDTYSGKIDL